VSVAEIEQLFHGRVAIYPARSGDGEARRIAIGRTPERRNLLVVFTLRVLGGKTAIQPISARYMHQREVEHYEKAAKTED
jgi:uncharacterized DUF497 family protein